jgi:hypothetical protein
MKSGPGGCFGRIAFSGRDADPLVEKRASGEWAEDDMPRNEAAVRRGRLVVSRRRTLRGS